MSQVTFQEFAGRGHTDIPQLFSQTRDFEFRGGRGRLVHQKLPTGPKGYGVVAVASTGHQASFVEHERVALTIPLAGRAEVRMANRRFVTRPGDMFAIGPSERKSSLIPRVQTGLYRSFTIVSPSTNGENLGEECWLHLPNFHGYLQLKHLIEYCFEVFADVNDMSEKKAALIEALVEDTFQDVLNSRADSAIKKDVHQLEGVVRNALAYMEAYFGEPLSISDIASAVGVGTRTLQSAFQTRRGMTPKQFLTECRIDAMHNLLMCPEPSTTVTTAAMASGFFHLGRCSLVYRARYGELPSKTLRRAKKTMM
jgi:AraC-like DNA-binding protein